MTSPYVRQVLTRSSRSFSCNIYFWGKHTHTGKNRTSRFVPLWRGAGGGMERESMEGDGRNGERGENGAEGERDPLYTLHYNWSQTFSWHDRTHSIQKATLSTLALNQHVLCNFLQNSCVSISLISIIFFYRGPYFCEIFSLHIYMYLY